MDRTIRLVPEILPVRHYSSGHYFVLVQKILLRQLQVQGICVNNWDVVMTGFMVNQVNVLNPEPQAKQFLGILLS